MEGDTNWSHLCRFRTRLPLTATADRNEKLKRRLRMWERGEIDELVRTIAGQQAVGAVVKATKKSGSDLDDEERRGKQARVQCAVGSRSKAMKGLVGGVANGSSDEKQRWAESLIPRSDEPIHACPGITERTAAAGHAWGKGSRREAKAAMKDVNKQRTGLASLPHVRLAPLSAPGPTGDRMEHLEAIIAFAGAGQRRRLFRALDSLTVRWAIGDLPASCQWLLNTRLMFLIKEREPTCKVFDDEEWTARTSLEDVPENLVVDAPALTPVQPLDAKGVGPSRWANSCGNTCPNACYLSIQGASRT